MLGILFTMAGALCGIANGLYVGFTTAGSKRDCAAIVVRFPCPVRLALSGV